MDVPPHILARRLEQERRRRRRRRATLGMALLAAAAGVSVALGNGVFSSSHARAQRRRLAAVAPIPLGRTRRTKPGGLVAVMAAGNAEIHRLVPLGLPVYCGAPRGNEVAFTFDDGPGVYTHLALRKLRQASERVTFFVVGKSINSWRGYLGPELRIAALGDHTYQHLDLATLPLGDVRSQLARTAQLITAQSGQPVDLWRPPYGADDPAVRRIARSLGLLEILWSTDSADSLGANWAGIIQNTEAGLRPGAIILFHENRGQTIRALTTLLPYLHRHHLRSVSVPELLASDPPSVAQLRRGLSGCAAHTRLVRGAG